VLTLKHNHKDRAKDEHMQVEEVKASCGLAEEMKHQRESAAGKFSFSWLKGGWLVWKALMVMSQH